MQIFRLFTLAMALACASGAASAQQLTGVSGSVLVNNGAGYREASPSAQLSAGTAVMARANSRAVIQYDARCSVPVAPGAVVMVAPFAPCGLEGQRATDYRTDDYTAQAGGGDGPSPSGYVIGAGVIGVVGIGIILVTTIDNGNSP